MPTGYDSINHVVAVRLRLSGIGTFYSRLAALEDDPEQDLSDTALASNPPRPVNLLANITSTRIQFHGYIDAEDEHFILKNISIYTKPTATGYPQ